MFRVSKKFVRPYYPKKNLTESLKNYKLQQQARAIGLGLEKELAQAKSLTEARKILARRR